ncbi:MAG: helix-turn-helix domain-containing protein [Caldilineaceae bacterium]|nr:helix-turn-helix domain-containing protein [Caldilineaceae bacterium]
MTKLTQQLSEPVLIRPIKTEADYIAALAEVEQMMDSVTPNTPEGDHFELLVTLIEAYEDEHYPTSGASDPISLIEFALDQKGLTRKDLEAYIGPRQRVWDIMEKRRSLSLSMIRRLEKGLGIPATLLIQEYPLRSNRDGEPQSNSVPATG